MKGKDAEVDCQKICWGYAEQAYNCLCEKSTKLSLSKNIKDYFYLLHNSMFINFLVKLCMFKMQGFLF